MILKAYCVFDCKSACYSNPMWFVSDGAFLRALLEVAADSSTTIGAFPSDMTAFCVGSFDDQSGSLLRCDPVPLGNVAALLARASGE